MGRFDQGSAAAASIASREAASRKEAQLQAALGPDPQGIKRDIARFERRLEILDEIVRNDFKDASGHAMAPADVRDAQNNCLAQIAHLQGQA